MKKFRYSVTVEARNGSGIYTEHGTFSTANGLIRSFLSKTQVWNTAKVISVDIALEDVLAVGGIVVNTNQVFVDTKEGRVFMKREGDKIVAIQ